MAKSTRYFCRNFYNNLSSFFQAPGSDTYIVFGEAQPEDLISASQRNAVKNITKAAEAPKPAIIEEDPAAEEDDEQVDAEGVEEKDIELVMQQVLLTKLFAKFVVIR